MEEKVDKKELGIKVELKDDFVFIKNRLENGIIIDFNGDVKIKNNNKITLISLKE